MDADRNTITQENRRICIQTEQAANQIVAPYDLTGAQAHMLLYILAHTDESGISLTQICQHLGYAKASGASLIKQLRRKGYIRVEFCKSDDRRKLLFATDKGTLLREHLEHAICSFHDRLFKGFSPAELAELDRLQIKLLQNLSAAVVNNSKEVLNT